MKIKFCALLRIFVRVLGLGLLVGVLGFAVWAATPLGPDAQAEAALQSGAGVRVSEGQHWLLFAPESDPQPVGFIFYPGGRVDYRSYAPVLRRIAAAGYPTVLVRMPLSLAVTAPNRADAVFLAYPEVGQWVIGGHSLGGAMAAEYVLQNPLRVRGLVFWAAYPAESSSLADWGGRVLSVYASQDGVADRQTVLGAAARLPQGTRWVEIAGGNHAQFGSYGVQPGDGTAQISAEAQQEQAAQAVMDLLAEIGGQP